MPIEGNPSNNNDSRELKKYETRKVKLSEKSETLFKDIGEIGNKIYDLKLKLSDDKNNKNLLDEIKTLEKRETELKNKFNENNQKIQNLNEVIIEKTVASTQAQTGTSKQKQTAISEKALSDASEQEQTLDSLLSQSEFSRKISPNEESSETTFQRLYDSEDELPVVKELAEDFRKKAEEKVFTKVFSFSDNADTLQSEDEIPEPVVVDNQDEPNLPKGETTKVASDVMIEQAQEQNNGINKTQSDEVKFSTSRMQININSNLEATSTEVKETTDKKITEKFETDEQSTDSSTSRMSKSSTNNLNSVAISDTDFRTDKAVEPKEFIESKPLSFDEMIRLLKRFSEQIVTLAKTSVEKNVKVTTSHFNGLLSNIATVENYIQEVAQRMNMFQVHLNKLTEAFNKRFLNDKAKDQAFDKLYESMQDYKDDFLMKAKKPVFLDLIRLYDDIQKMISQESNKNLELICDVIIEILYRNDVDVITDAPERFDRSFQKSVKRVHTDDKDMDRKVEDILKIGFIQGRQIIRPQEVSVYIYNGKD